MRAGIEGSNSVLIRNGLDKLKVHGRVKCELIAELKTTGQNIKRFIKFMRGGYKEKSKKEQFCGIPAPNCA